MQHNLACLITVLTTVLCCQISVALGFRMLCCSQPQRYHGRSCTNLASTLDEITASLTPCGNFQRPALYVRSTVFNTQAVVLVCNCQYSIKRSISRSSRPIATFWGNSSLSSNRGSSSSPQRLRGTELHAIHAAEMDIAREVSEAVMLDV